MKYIQLGKTDINVSRICLGTMTWGMQNSQSEAFEQMDYALSQGVNFWDTAEMYPIPPNPKTYAKTETMIGNWLESRQKREKIVLATKFSPLPWARGEKNPTINKQNIITAVDNSLKRLKTDYIDLYQFHWPTNRSHYHFQNWWEFEPSQQGEAAKQQVIQNILETLQTCDELIKVGKIRHIGLSDDSAWGVNQFLKLAEKYDLPRIASLQHEYNLLRRRDETDIMETCALEDVSYLSWSPLHAGILSGKYLNGNTPEGSRMSSPEGRSRYAAKLNPIVDAAVEQYIAIAEKYNLDVCQMALAFTIRRPYMTCSIIGATNLQQLKTNIDAFSLELSEEILIDIENVRREYPVPY
ncbi:aldo/keto reductase [Francisella sp. 19X1-34]|uniref:aldo/keto reductase n=1 Tax=Francisella sp. 19X1-34 TaxID=3087177 RepID=UPI002E32B2F7|nr:aldo/keto reductase [Francisella sp. 19X1-34]MED7788558.1 aldo/keto reductase [Francisella sp. 19X1-34]